MESFGFEYNYNLIDKSKMKLLSLTLANIFFVSSKTTKLDNNLRYLEEEDVKADTVLPTGPGGGGANALDDAGDAANDLLDGAEGAASSAVGSVGSFASSATGADSSSTGIYPNYLGYTGGVPGPEFVNVLNTQKLSGDLLESVIDDDGAEYFWVMAPKPGYELPFDITKDELVVIQGDTSDAAAVSATFANIGGDRYKTEYCALTLADAAGTGKYDSFTVTVDAVGCPTYGGVEGVVGYQADIDTYTYLTFTDPEEFWRVATFADMYDTVENGGMFPWDDNTPTDNIYKGVRQGGEYLFLTAATLIMPALALV